MSSILICSGRLIDPFEIEKYHFTAEELIWPLGNLCRYSGQISRFFCVAEHECHLIEKVPKKLKRAAALHDLNEGLTNDLPRPFKQRLPDYVRFEERVQRHIFNIFGEPWENMQALAEYDHRICQDEMQQLFTPAYDLGVKPLGVEIQGWSPDIARFHLHKHFVELGLAA